MSASSIIRRSTPSIARYLISPIYSLIQTVILGHFLSDHFVVYARFNTLLSPITCFFSILVVSLTSKVSTLRKESSVIHLVQLSLILSFSIGICLTFITFCLKSFLVGQTSYNTYYFFKTLTFPFLLINSTITGILQGFDAFKKALFLAVSFVVLNSIFLVLFVVVFQSEFLWVFGLFQVFALILQSGYGLFLVSKVCLINQINLFFFSFRLTIQKFKLFSEGTLYLLVRAFFVDLIYFLNGFIVTRRCFHCLIYFQYLSNFWVVICSFIDGIGATLMVLAQKRDINQLLIDSRKVFAICGLFLTPFIFGTLYLIKLFTFNSTFFVFSFFLLFVIGLFVNFNSFSFESILFSLQRYKLPTISIIIAFLIVDLPFIGISLVVNHDYLVLVLFLNLICINYFRYIRNSKYLNLIINKKGQFLHEV
ncbi:hypothetical protein P9112_008899 [Eukaryota sp. TZLM1-RC]